MSKYNFKVGSPLSVFIKCFIGCIIGLLCGALLLCFEAAAFLFPFTVTLMALSGAGVVTFGILWLFTSGYGDLL